MTTSNPPKNICTTDKFSLKENTTENTTESTIENDNHFHTTVMTKTQQWVECVVIGLNLCPFARAVHIRNKIRYVVNQTPHEADVLLEIIKELAYLASVDADTTDTTLIMFPNVFADFLDFNDFLGEAEDELWVQGYEGEFQLASFHPYYQFAETDNNDTQNNTNRSPYPTIHILREASIDKAITSFPDLSSIYEANILSLKRLGHEGYNDLLRKTTV
ncbi:MAG: hypothetical protein RL344_1229 [Pseudomonadota bacterium]|jgi:hypothetical protein